MRETGFEAFLVDLGLAPDERLGVVIVSVDERVDVLSDQFDRGEGRVGQRLSWQDRKPDFHLIGPSGPGGRE